MKSRIIKILKGTQGVVSGQALSAELGISRVSIWKHIQKLQTLGYEIQATAKGCPIHGSFRTGKLKFFITRSFPLLWIRPRI